MKEKRKRLSCDFVVLWGRKRCSAAGEVTMTSGTHSMCVCVCVTVCSFVYMCECVCCVGPRAPSLSPTVTSDL